MAVQLLVPVCSASPVWGGSLTATPTTSGTFEPDPGDWQNFKYLAVPSLGFSLDKIEIFANWESIPDSGTQSQYWTKATIFDDHGTLEWSTTPDIDRFNFGFVYEPSLGGYVWESRAKESRWDREGSSWWSYSNTITTMQTSLTAVAHFVREKTHLPIFDDRENGTGILVYDDRPGGTGLLVADY